MYYDDINNPTPVKKRIGKDLLFNLKLTVNKEIVNLEDKDISVEIIAPTKEIILPAFTVKNDTITFELLGKNQTSIGKYSVTIWMNKGKAQQTAADYADIVELVRHSWEEKDGE